MASNWPAAMSEGKDQPMVIKGALNKSDPANPRIVFSASQFLGLQRNDTRTWTTQDIRPGDPQGAISDRRNWNTWGKGVPQQVLHVPLEPFVTVADPADERLTLHTASQSPSFVRIEIARLLGWPENRVRVRDGVVEAWPSLGYGRFGPGVVLGGAPRFARAVTSGAVTIRDRDSLAQERGLDIDAVTYDDNDQMIQAFQQERCDAITSDASQLAGIPRLLVHTDGKKAPRAALKDAVKRVHDQNKEFLTAFKKLK